MLVSVLTSLSGFCRLSVGLYGFRPSVRRANAVVLARGTLGRRSSKPASDAVVPSHFKTMLSVVTGTKCLLTVVELSEASDMFAQWIF